MKGLVLVTPQWKGVGDTAQPVEGFLSSSLTTWIQSWNDLNGPLYPLQEQPVFWPPRECLAHACLCALIKCNKSVRVCVCYANAYLSACRKQKLSSPLRCWPMSCCLSSPHLWATAARGGVPAYSGLWEWCASISLIHSLSLRYKPERTQNLPCYFQCTSHVYTSVLVQPITRTLALCKLPFSPCTHSICHDRVGF